MAYRLHGLPDDVAEFQRVQGVATPVVVTNLTLALGRLRQDLLDRGAEEQARHVLVGPLVQLPAVDTRLDSSFGADLAVELVHVVGRPATSMVPQHDGVSVGGGRTYTPADEVEHCLRVAGVHLADALPLLRLAG